ncbi:MAG: AbrB/MazE/SpoVT family DNA-binding domain-containing protein [Neorhizobium sp.]|nr:AbrB/MazE/SpoVT family DNA-binding domain-containing protein [Neorhizobium sp.]
MTDDVIARISDKGEITLPEAVLERQHWDAGTNLVVEETPDGVLLKKRPIFKPTAQGAAFGMLKYKGKPKTIEEMNEGILEEAKRSFLRSVDPD